MSKDHFLDGRVTISQPVAGYRAGSDPVFLAAAVPLRDGDQVLDLGCGVGTAGLCLLTRAEALPNVIVTGLEIQPELTQFARLNAAANGRENHFRVAEGCVITPPAEVPPHHFHHVITNPPWYEPGTTRPPSSESKAVGHIEAVNLAVWLERAVVFLRPKGRLFVIHRADRLGDILAGLAPLKVGEVRVFPLWPKPGKAATRVVVAARKDSRTPLTLLPGLILHHEDGRYTEEADDILRRRGDLFLG